MAGGWQGQAKRYGAPLAFLAAATVAVLLIRAGLNSDPTPSSSTVPATTTASTLTTRNATPPRQRRYYRVRAGQTLSDVAIRFDTSVEQLLVLNPGIQPTNLTVGQRVRVK